MENKRWRIWFRYGLIFFVTFEITAQLSYELRPHAMFPPLALVPGPAPQELALARRTSEQGNPSDIARGQKRRWAVVGSSWTDAVGVRQNEIWPSLLQQRFVGNDVHIENYSGDTSEVIRTLRYLRFSRRHFDKIFLALDGPVEGSVDDGWWASGFRHSYRWLGIPFRFPLSLLMGWQLFKTADFYQKFQMPEILPKATAANSPTLSAENQKFLTTCYAEEMHRLGCKSSYQSRRDSEPTLDPWVIWQETYLQCQAKVDRHCGIPARASKMPYSVESHKSLYEKAVLRIYRIGLQVADRVYFVGHPMLGVAADLPDGAVDSTNTSLSVFKNKVSRLVPLSTIAGTEFRAQKSASLESIAMKLTTDTIALHRELLSPQEARRQLFSDAAHLSVEGHQRVADIIEARIRKDDPQL